jgi:beta-lactam-binding protein with PASTA domain
MAHRISPVYRLVTLTLAIGALLVGLTGTSTATPGRAGAPAMPASGTVPSVVGQSEGEATWILQSAGYVVAVKEKLVSHGDCSQDGVVSAQSPRGGATLAPGRTVTITVLVFTIFCP